MAIVEVEGGEKEIKKFVNEKIRSLDGITSTATLEVYEPEVEKEELIEEERSGMRRRGWQPEL